MQRQSLFVLLTLLVTGLLVACGGDPDTPPSTSATPTSPVNRTTEATPAVDGPNTEAQDVNAPTSAPTGYTGKIVIQTATTEIHAWDLADSGALPIAVLDLNAAEMFAYGPMMPSPNGDLLTYEKRTILKLNQVTIRDMDAGTDKVIPSDGGEATLFSTQPSPSNIGTVAFVHQSQIFNSDNTFVEQSGNLDIALWDGTTIRLLTDDEAEDNVPQLSADGQTIIFVSKRDRSDGDFYRLSVNGNSTPTRISIENDPAIAGIKQGLSVVFRMTPDGSKIVFPAMLEAGGEALYVMDTATGDLTQIETPEGMQLYNYDISSDGSIVAYTGINLNAANPLEGPVYWVRTEDPTNLQTLGDTGSHGALTLHPDGMTIFVIKTDFTDEEPYQLLALPIDGSEPRVLATDSEKMAMSTGRLFYLPH